MNHGCELLLTLLPWMITLLTAAAICDGYDFPGPPPRLDMTPDAASAAAARKYCRIRQLRVACP